MQPDLNLRHGAYGIGYPQVNTLVYSGPNGIEANTNHFLVSEPFMKSSSAEYHEGGHCLYWDTIYEGETEALVNFPYAYVSLSSYFLLVIK